jgi:cyclic pyranopterin phosphate synthase
MPEETFGQRYEFLPRAEILSFEELERLAGIFGGLGVAKVRITGGEPLLRHDLPNLIARISKLDSIRDLALTTNATLLTRQAESLAKAGLQRLTISLDSIDEEIFKAMNGNRLSVETVLEGIGAAEDAGYSSIKINCVVQKGVNDGAIVSLARHFKGTGHILRFIEFMDVGTRNAWDLSQVLSAREIAERIGSELPIEAMEPNYRGEVAQRWRYLDGEGEIGIISSVTAPFCGDCTRLRLTTDGKLVTCLFASEGTDLRAPLREGASDDELRDLIRSVWRVRSDRYSEERGEILDREADGVRSRDRRVEMYQIGG